MIARIWHGWTTPGNADPYEAHLRDVVLPGIEERIDGFRGVYLLGREAGDEVEFVTVTLWDSLDAVREFAGEDYEVAVVPEEARRLLTRFDERSAHYETLLEPSCASTGPQPPGGGSAVSAASFQ
ncbi:MAG TPA: antibiotic biosynthesis monooxygenase [Gaiellaceae bacterium]|jgi:heme-degrading monooxygenase HmoA|nr:antibiotic biosynthesis monooxygenase [Gaiellaceae bacterium]